MKSTLQIMGAMLALSAVVSLLGGRTASDTAARGGSPYGAPVPSAALLDTNTVAVRLDRATAPLSDPALSSADILSRLSREAIRSGGPAIEPAPADPTPVSPSRAAAMANRPRRKEEAGDAATGWGWLADEVSAARRSESGNRPSDASWPNRSVTWRDMPEARDGDSATGFDFNGLTPSLSPGRQSPFTWPWDRSSAAPSEQPSVSPWPELADPWSTPLQGTGKR
jgi:hypothetical protein